MPAGMSKTWNVAANEFNSIVLKKSFVLSLLILPSILTAILLIGIFKSPATDKRPTVGYIDKAGLLKAAGKEADLQAAGLKLFPYHTQEAAKSALVSGQIQICFEIPGNFPADEHIVATFIKTPSTQVMRQFQEYLRMSLISNYPKDIRTRVVKGFSVIKRSLDGSREMLRDPSINQVLPLFIGFSFIFLIFLTSGYLMQAVAAEKENRTVEILITSVSPSQLIGGKVAGIIAAGFVLFIFWFLFTALFVLICGYVLDIQWFRAIVFDGGVLLMILVITIPTYVLVAGLMVGIGTAIAEAREGTQASFLFLILLVLPFYFIEPLTSEPDGVIAIVLSVAPFTSLMAMVFRNMFVTIPFWQVVLSLLIASGAAALALRLGVGAFRSGLLSYGKSFSWKAFFANFNKASKNKEVHE